MTENRKYPRVGKQVPVKICQEDGNIVTQTANISRSGAYCRVNKYIEPMSRMKIHLLLPTRRHGKGATKKITCQGVVVRTESPAGEDYHNIAIFFNDISLRDADSIAEYVSSFLEKEI